MFPDSYADVRLEAPLWGLLESVLSLIEPNPFRRWACLCIALALLSLGAFTHAQEAAPAAASDSETAAESPPPVAPPVDAGIDRDAFEHIALGDWMLRFAYLLAVVFSAAFAAILPFVPLMIRVRVLQRVIYFFYSIAIRTYYLFRHTLWSVRWFLLAGFLLLLLLGFVLFLSYGVELMLI